MIPQEWIGSSVHSVAFVATKDLQLVEELSKQHPSVRILSSTLISLVQLCLLHLYPVPKGWKDTPIPTNLADAAVDLQKCVVHLEKTLFNLCKQTPNHFGTFRALSYIGELNVIHAETCSLLQQACGDAPMQNRDVSLDSPIANIRAFFPRIWWKQKFGLQSSLVKWVEFENEFIATYGQQPTPSIDFLRNELLESAQINDDGMDIDAITVEKFDEFTYEHSGLYEAYQAISDPCRLVYSMGLVGDESNIVASHPVAVKGLLGYTVVQVCCGGQHAAVLTESGEIYTWGRGGYGRLGHGQQEDLKNPRRVDALAMPGHKCIQVACGFAYTAAITVNNNLYTWGAGENGRLGHGDFVDRLLPVEVTALHGMVRMVYAGSVHTCALTTEGVPYSWGKFEYTGHNTTEDVLCPEEIVYFKGLPLDSISVGPGGYHTIALSKSGRVYTWGHNRVGQLGYGNSPRIPKNSEGAFFQPLPKEVASLRNKNIKQVVAGWGHSAAVTEDGNLYVCGRNYKGQLGLGDPQSFQLNERGHPYQPCFRHVDSLDGIPVAQIACGGEHTVVRAEGSSIYSFGAGHKGQLGHGRGNNQSEYLPKLVDALAKTRRTMLNIACGNNCTLVLAGDKVIPRLANLCLEVIYTVPELSQQLMDMDNALDMAAFRLPIPERQGISCPRDVIVEGPQAELSEEEEPDLNSSVSSDDVLQR